MSSDTAPLTSVQSSGGIQYAAQKKSYMSNYVERRKHWMVFGALGIIAIVLLSVGASHNWWHTCGWTNRCGVGHCQQLDLECPSCNGGYCNQTETHEPSCRSGHCAQEYTQSPQCFGGHCMQMFAENPTCEGGYCNQLNFTGTRSCFGGHCTA